MSIKVTPKVNAEDPHLYCTYCKNSIRLTEKYLIEESEELGEKICRPLHLDCIQEVEEEWDNDNVNDKGW